MLLYAKTYMYQIHLIIIYNNSHNWSSTQLLIDQIEYYFELLSSDSPPYIVSQIFIFIRNKVYIIQVLS